MFSSQPTSMNPERANGVDDHAVDGLSQSVEGLRQDAASVLERVSDQAASLRQRGLDALHDHQQQMRSQARQARERTLDYVREEPVKGLLIGVAAGAALMAVLGWIGRSRRSR